MRQVFRQRYAREQTAGAIATIKYLMASLADAISGGVAERATRVHYRLVRPHLSTGSEGGSGLPRALLTDLGQAVRVLTRAPLGTTALAIATLALGIGANAAIFSVIHTVLLAPLPYPSADRVAIAWRSNPDLGDISMSPLRTDMARWSTSTLLEGVTTYFDSRVVVTGFAEPETFDGVRADADVFAFTGTRVEVGRAFTPAETHSAGAAHVALVSHAIWRQRFGASAQVLGRIIEIDDVDYEIIGVLPASFRLPMTDADIVMPLAPPAPAVKGQPPARSSLSALVRMKPSATIAATQAELTSLATGNGGLTGNWRISLMRPGDLSGPTFRRTLLILFGAVGCVLLIACANVAHLVLARNAARRREIAVRAALGASRARLVRQLFFESVLLALAGAATGLVVAVWGIQAVAALRPVEMRMLEDVHVSATVFGFAFVLALATGVLFGLLPALSATRGLSPDGLKHGAPALQGSHGALVRRTITVAEIALALLLLAGAGLLLRSYARVLTADRGFQPEGLLTVNLQLPEARYRSRASQTDFMKRAAGTIAALPGVTRVVMASGVPPEGGMIFGELQIEDLHMPPGAAVFGGGFVQPGFFESLQIPVRSGRTFTTQDVGSHVALVNQRTADRFWPGGSAVGKRLRLGATGTWDTIIGVVADVEVDHGEPGGVQLYFPLADRNIAGDTTMLVAVDGAASDLIAPVKAQIRSLDPKLPLDDTRSLEGAMSTVTARPRFNVVLLTIFAAIGLALAMIGIYGVVSYSVRLRTREIGLRMALGAAPAAIARAVLKETLVLTAAGTALGLGGALAGAQVMKKLLFGISPNDPLTLGGVAMVLALTAVVAAVVPAQRAMRVDPMIALRTE